MMDAVFGEAKEIILFREFNVKLLKPNMESVLRFLKTKTKNKKTYISYKIKQNYCQIRNLDISQLRHY